MSETTAHFDWQAGYRAAADKCAAEHYTREEVREMLVKIWLWGWNDGYDVQDEVTEPDDLQRRAEHFADRLLARKP